MRPVTPLIAALAALGLGSAALAQADPFAALYAPKPGDKPDEARSSGRSGSTSVTGAVGRSYAGSQTGGFVSLSSLDLLPANFAPFQPRLDTGNGRYLKERPRIAVPSYALAFVQGAQASASGAGWGSEIAQRRTKIATRLVGLSDEMARDLADEAWRDLKAQFEAAGYEVVDIPELQANARLQQVSRHAGEYGGQGIIDSRATKAWVSYGPRDLGLIKGYAAETGMGMMAAAGNSMQLAQASKDLDAIVLLPRVLIDYADMDSTGNATYRGSGQVEMDLRFGLNPVSRTDFIWGNERGGAMPGWMTTKGYASSEQFGVLYQTADKSDSVAMHNALASAGFGSMYRQSLVYDVEVSPQRFAALTRAAFKGYNAALVAEVKKARGG